MQTKRRLYALVFIATIVCAGVGVCTKAVAADTANIIELTLGQKHWIGESHYVICRFDKKPQLGTAILKIASSIESVGQFWFWQIAKHMI